LGNCQLKLRYWFQYFSCTEWHTVFFSSKLRFVYVTFPKLFLSYCCLIEASKRNQLFSIRLGNVSDILFSSWCRRCNGLVVGKQLFRNWVCLLYSLECQYTVTGSFSTQNWKQRYCRGCSEFISLTQYGCMHFYYICIV